MNCNGANGGRSSSLSLYSSPDWFRVYCCVRALNRIRERRTPPLSGGNCGKVWGRKRFFFQVPSPPDVIQTLDRQLRLALGRWPTGRPSPCGVCRRWSSSSWQRPPTGTRCSAASYSTTSRPSRTTRTCALTRRSPTSSSTTFGERSWQR